MCSSDLPNIVTITSGIATLTNTAGNSGTAIFANAGTGGATVTSGTASVLGTNQAAIQIFSDGAATLTSDIARTTQSSDALSVQSGTAIRIKSNTITTQGINARGIIVGGFNNPANLTYSSLAINSGSITTAGQNSYGIYITPTTGTTAITSGTIEVRGTDTGTSGAIIANGSNVNVTSGTITNSGTGNRFGVSAQVLGGIANPGNLAVTTGSIATVGTIRPAGTQLRYSAGIIAASAAGPITIASNAIATSGAQSAGIRVEASDGVTAFAFSQAAGSAPVSVVRTFGATRGVD